MARTVLYAAILLNIVDIVLHVAINQPELLRITGNILVIMAASSVLQAKRSNFALVTALGLYLMLNGAFVVLHGIGGAGIVFISLTTILVSLSLFLHKIK